MDRQVWANSVDPRRLPLCLHLLNALLKPSCSNFTVSIANFSLVWIVLDFYTITLQWHHSKQWSYLTKLYEPHHEKTCLGRCMTQTDLLSYRSYLGPWKILLQQLDRQQKTTAWMCRLICIFIDYIWDKQGVLFIDLLLYGSWTLLWSFQLTYPHCS